MNIARPVLQEVVNTSLDSVPKHFTVSSSRQDRKDPYKKISDLKAFEEWWKMYFFYCKDIECSPGDKKAAAFEWLVLERNGADMALVMQGTILDIEKRRNSKSTYASPYGCRYLAGSPKHPTPYWQVAIEEDEMKKTQEAEGKVEPAEPVTQKPTLAALEKGWNDMEDVAPVDDSNQGIDASIEWHGLKFRSVSEVQIARALDKKKVLFFPNCRCIAGTSDRQIKELDFLVCDNGRWGVLEVDGSQWHQSAAIDHNRDRQFQKHGIDFIQRYDAEACFNDPHSVVEEFLDMMKRFYARR